MDIERHVDVAAPPDRVWAVLTDVERWPEWTASVRSAKLLDGAPLQVGSRVRIHQPRLPAAIWTVTVWQASHYFEWESVTPGVRSVAGHGVAVPDDAGAGSRVTLTVDWSGPFAPAVRLLFGRLSRRYVEMEAQGLRRRCETTSPATNGP